MKKRTYTLGDKVRTTTKTSSRGRKKYPDQKITITEEEIILVVDGVQVAKRPNTRQRTPWVSLEPGFRVFDDGSLTDITVYQDGSQIHQRFILVPLRVVIASASGIQTSYCRLPDQQRLGLLCIGQR